MLLLNELLTLCRVSNLHVWLLVTFRVRRSRGEMYIGHDRLCVCVSLCLSMCLSVPRRIPTQYCMDPDVS